MDSEATQKQILIHKNPPLGQISNLKKKNLDPKLVPKSGTGSGRPAGEIKTWCSPWPAGPRKNPTQAPGGLPAKKNPTQPPGRPGSPSGDHFLRDLSRAGAASREKETLHSLLAGRPREKKILHSLLAAGLARNEAVTDIYWRKSTMEDSSWGPLSPGLPN